jgi:hypothetical protein
MQKTCGYQQNQTLFWSGPRDGSVHSGFIQFYISVLVFKIDLCVQMYSSYRCRLLNIMDVIFEACSLWEYQAPVESKMGACILMHYVKY